ncbi:MAG: hypothetical protein U0Q11_07900 [Vicinamibacterales bacterium]
MSRISQAFKRSGHSDARPEAASSGPDAIFSAYAPEEPTETDTPAPASIRASVRHGRASRTVPFSASGSSTYAQVPMMPAWPPADAPARGAQRPADAPAPSALAASTTDDGDKLVDVVQLSNYIGFLFRAIRRRWLLAFAIVVVMMGAITGATFIWPKAYHIDAKLLVQRNDVMASLVNPGRTIAREAEEPTRATQEIVLQHENLLSVIEETDLMRRWEQTRTPILKLKDRIMIALRGPRSEAAQLDGMVGLLEQRVKVFATPEGTVTFDLNWPDPQLGYDIVDKVIQNFLQFRRVSETSAISDSIAILDQSVQTLEQQVTQTIAELPKRPVPPARRLDPAPVQTAAAPVVPTTPAGPPADVTRRLTRLRSDLELKRQEIARLDEAHRGQLSDAQTRLTAAKMVYGDDYPAVIALRQTVAQLSRESPELVNLRRDVQALESEYDTLANAVQSADEAQRTPGTSLPSASDLPRARISAPPIEVDLSGMNNTEGNDPTSLRLKVELAELASVRERANAARAELQSSQAGFKYQYKMIRPPQVPRAPSSPIVPLWLGAGAIASLLLAVLAAVAADIASGRILEAWQVERQLGVPVAVKLQER